MATKANRKRVKRSGVSAVLAQIEALPDQTEECYMQTALDDLRGALGKKIAGGYSPLELLEKLDPAAMGVGKMTMLRYIRAVKSGKAGEVPADRSSSNGTSSGPRPVVSPKVPVKAETPKTPAAATAAKDTSQGGEPLKVQPIDTIGVEQKKTGPKTVSSITNNLRRREY